jgi:hypothetical protein
MGKVVCRIRTRPAELVKPTGGWELVSIYLALWRVETLLLRPTDLLKPVDGGSMMESADDEQ